MASIVLLTATTAPLASAQSAQPDRSGGSADALSIPPLRDTLESCIAFWDPKTHMSKAEWRAACRRSIKESKEGRLDEPMPGNAAKGYRSRPGSRR